MLIDSNIIIYAAIAEHQWLRDFIAEHAPAVSAVSYVEVLGYGGLTEQDREYFEDFFAASLLLPISNDVLEQAVRLRQKRRIALGDALVAATALVHNLMLVTRNTDDFDWIENLRLRNPFADENDAT
jgi:toxin FitB